MISQDLVKQALGAIKRSADYEFFFAELKSPQWIEPLAKEGMFRSPPAPEREGDYIRFPLWAESRYLVRMAAVAPQEVLTVIEGMPSTENVRVHEDLADAAFAMPAGLAARLVPKAELWLQSPYQLRLPDKLARLMSHLATGGEVAAALRLTRSLLAVDVPSQPFAADQDRSRLRPEPQARFDEWSYEQVLKTHVPTLVQGAGMETFELLSSILDSAVSLSYPDAEEGKDYSYIWRPAIEDDPQNLRHGVRTLLVEAVRDAALQVVRDNPQHLQEIIEKLEVRRWEVFHRIALHLLRENPAIVPDMVERHVTDATRAEETGLFHEFWLLVRDVFKHLSPRVQSAVLDLLDQRLAVDLAEAQQEQSENERTEAARSARLWLFHRLSILQNVLPPPYEERRAGLAADFGDLPHPEFLSYSSAGWVGPTSPKTREELEAEPVEDILRFLKTWSPPTGWRENTPEGLSRTLAGAVGSGPARFAKAAEAFRDVAPPYVRGLVSGLEEASKAKQSFDWEPVLKLCEWVVEQPQEIPGYESEYRDLDPGWKWTRKAIANLLSSGFNERNEQIPITLRELVWRVLLPLTNDEDPTPEDEKRFGGDNMDPVTLAINTTRGEAIHAVVRYALWVRRAEPSKQVGFGAIPEVREVLEKHLDPAVDPSLAIRSVYGLWFPWIVLLDPEWAKVAVSKVFPGEDHEDLHRAAWDAYIIFAGVYDNVFEILRNVYAQMIEPLGKTVSRNRGPYSPTRRLVEHLMIYYWRGALEITDELLQLFYRTAPAELRAHALEFIGRSLHGEDEKPEIPEAVLGRYKSLWDARLLAARNLSRDELLNELPCFGWWFSSGSFDERWSLTNLLEVLRLARRVKPVHLVVERLSELVDSNLSNILEVLRLILSDQESLEEADLSHESVERILRIGLAAQDASVVEQAKRILDLLGAHGIRDFDHLLTNAGQS